MSLEVTSKGHESCIVFDPIIIQQLQSTYVVYLEKENDGFVIDCPELSVTTQGNTEQEAIINVIEAIELFLETEGKSNNFNIDLRTK